MTHTAISPAILYWGTPVTIISSTNEDGTTNLCPISSAFWLGSRCMLGFAANSKTPQNMLRTGQCVINLPDESMTDAVNGLALTTGSNPLPPGKIDRGYSYAGDKWARAGLTPQDSDVIRPQRVLECPVQMECGTVIEHPMLQDSPALAGTLVTLEVCVVKTHVHDDLRMQGHQNRIDPDKWRPMIMSFQEFYGLGKGKVDRSKLANVEEEKYRALVTHDETRQALVEKNTQTL